MPASDNLVIRPAEESDIEPISHFGKQLVSLHHNLDVERFIPATRETAASYSKWLNSQLARSDVLIMVAELAGNIIGYSYAALEGFDYMALRGPAGVIHDIFVAPKRRGIGAGRSLLSATLTELATRGAAQIVLSAAYRNEPAQRLFASAGFRPTMVEMTKTLKLRANTTNERDVSISAVNLGERVPG